MKLLFRLILLLLFSFPSFCQTFQNISSNNSRIFEVFSIGDSIQKFNNLLSCGTHSDDLEIVDLRGRLNCRVFSYLPAIKNPVDAGGVKFYSVLLFPDSLKFITAIAFNKTYLNTNTSINPRIIAKKDYSALEEFISSSLQLKGKKYKEHHKKGEFSGLIWLKDGTKYLLRKYDLAKRKKKISQILTFEISKSD